jgi:hypothetical protein
LPVYRRRRVHGKSFGQFHAGIAGGLQNAEQGGLFGVVDTGRIAGGGTDAPIGLGNQCFVVERLARRIAPEFGAYLAVHVLGQGFGESVGQCLQDDGRIVVVVLAEALQMRFDAEPCGHCKTSDPVSHAGFPGGDEIGQTPTAREASFTHTQADG